MAPTKLESGAGISTPSKTDFLHTPAVRTALPFINGGLAGCIATTVIQPVDMIKVRLQLAGEGAKSAGVGPIAIAAQIIKEKGPLELYSGLSAGLLRQCVYTTARMGFFGTFMNGFQERAKAKERGVTFLERATASLAAGGLGAIMGNPADLALIRMQSDGLRPTHLRSNYRSVFDALYRISSTEGVAALWSGAYPTVIRAMALNFGQLAFYSEAKSRLQSTTLPVPAQNLGASLFAGFFASFFSLPFDFLKTRLQKQTRGADGRLPYSGMMDCAKKVVKEEGLLRFYRGFGTYYVRIAPHAMITVLAADYLGVLTK